MSDSKVFGIDTVKRYSEYLAVGIAFGIFLLVTCYKLTGSALWYDEAIEYWYSKIMFGELPMAGVADGTVNMYQRIILTYQPPLYNLIMYFWLKISDTELWFHIFGVLMGVIAMIGVYKAVKKFSNFWIASMAVVCSSTVYQLNYYWQECSEYCLMLACLCWAMFFWISLLEETNNKNMILFTVTCILSIYSQYGAAFPVVAMAITAYIYILLKKNKKQSIQITCIYIIALVFTAIPLYFFFLKKQIINQQNERSTMTIPQFPDGLLHDFFDSLEITFNWNFFTYIYSETFVRGVLIAILILALISIMFGRNKLVKIIIGTNVFCWVCYYIAVKLGIYSYGTFGRRYNIFFTPMWIVMVCGTYVEISAILSKLPPIAGRFNASYLRWVFVAVCMVVVCYFTVYNWTGKLKDHAYKSDIRGAVNEWYAVKAYEKPTIVYYASDPGFAYYVRHNDSYNEHVEDRVTYMAWDRDLSVDEYSAFVDETYGYEWPEEVYIVASNYGDDLEILIESFTYKGYVQEGLYDVNAGKLIHLLQER